MNTVQSKPRALRLVSLLCISIAVAACEGNGSGSESADTPTVSEAELPLYEIPFSDTGSIKIYEGIEGPLVKVTGKIGVDDPVVAGNLMAQTSLAEMYRIATHSERVPEELVSIDKRHQARRAEDLRQIEALGLPTGPAEPFLLEKSFNSFNSIVCTRTFWESSTNYYVPIDCSYSTNSWLALSHVAQAGAYDWIFGWNEQTWGPASIQLVNRLGNPPNTPLRLIDTYGGSCTLQPQTWGYCYWGGSFSGKWAAVTNYYAQSHLPGSAPGLGVTIHDQRFNVR